jgi:hypothetical protein
LHRAESQISLDKRIEAAVRGDERPELSSEWVALARHAESRQFYAAAVSLYSEAFKADPGLVDGRTPSLRYQAACAAALAGCQAGRDQSAPSRTDLAVLRTRALEWLGAELAQRLKDVPEVGSPRIKQLLLTWKGDGALAGLRPGSPTVGQLPDREQQSWQAFWKEIDALLEKTPKAASKPTS